MPVKLPDDPTLTPILDQLEHGIPDYLTVENRCRLIQKIGQSVLNTIISHKAYILNETGYIVGTTCAPFNREDEILAALFSTLTYSDRFHDFFARNAEQLGQEQARQISLGKFQESWQTLDSGQKLKTLGEIAAAQLHLFQHEGLRFTAPTLLITEMTGLRGSFNEGAWPLSQKVQDKKIMIQKAELERPAIEICKTNWHEHIHFLCQQFAAAAKTGDLTQLNPFHTDAQMIYERRKYRTIVSGFVFPRSYAADPEEKLANSTMELFAASWSEHSRRWPQFKMKLGL